jgi:cell division protein FtsB
MEAKEKEVLLDEIGSVLISKDKNVTLSLAITVLSVVMLVLFLFVPKIYLSNNIYKTSVEIENLKKEYLSLKDENKILKSKIAQLKYKNGITH